MTTALKADFCRACDGNGRINDTTYNRAGGDDVECGKCYGSGLGQQSIARIVKDRSRAAPSAGLREALEALADKDRRFEKTGSPNPWTEVLARQEFARAALTLSKDK